MIKFDVNLIKNKILYLFSQINLLKEDVKYLELIQEFNKINIKLSSDKVWSFPNKAKDLIEKSYNLELKIKKIDFLSNSLNELYDFFKLAVEEMDKVFLKDILFNLLKLEKKIINLKFQSIFKNKNDILNCYCTFQPGSGGLESQDWAYMLMKMYLRWAEMKKFQVQILDFSSGDICGLKSATLKIKGKYAYGWLRTETGVHRLVRKSPFDSNKKRHTSFSSIFVYPEIENKIDVIINDLDIRVDVYKSSGAGGQHVNKTESAVRITHIPTGIVVQCQSGRSQHKNKDQAIKQLKSKIYAFEVEKKNKEKKILEDNKTNITWGSQIRSYILDSSIVKDVRTGMESRNIQSILNGNIDNFIIASLRAGL